MSKHLSSFDNILTKTYNLLLLLMNYVILVVHHAKTLDGVVIFRLDRIGDFVLWLSAAKAYRDVYPNQKITLIANSAWADLATHFPYWDNVIALDTGLFYKNWRYRWNHLLRIRKSGYETAIQPIYSRDILQDDSLILVSGARYRIGWQGDSSHIRPGLKRIS
ncbi:MAG: hypothetical protein ABSB19_01750, partial [Methylomonas sp.]